MRIISDLVPVSEQEKWKRIIEKCGRYDTYHLPEYHQLHQDLGYGNAYLFVFEYGMNMAAFPFLLNCIGELAGREYCSHTDITSVYGYPGAVTSIDRNDPGADNFRRRFQAALREYLNELDAVTLFSRLNPLISTSWLFQGMCSVCPVADTVSIDLSKPEASILGDMRENHRYRIRRAMRHGVTVDDDRDFKHLSDFISSYRKTMDRHKADDTYYFPIQYFSKLKDTMGHSLKLFHARKSGEIISSFLFFATGDIVQYHLSGTPDEYLQFDGPRVVLYHAALWAKSEGYRWLHLGGGVGANEDSLFHFKAGFSEVRQPFELIRMIVNERVYKELTGIRTAPFSRRHAETRTFFPSYRQPVL